MHPWMGPVATFTFSAQSLRYANSHLTPITAMHGSEIITNRDYRELTGVTNGRNCATSATWWPAESLFAERCRPGRHIWSRERRGGTTRQTRHEPDIIPTNRTRTAANSMPAGPTQREKTER